MALISPGVQVTVTDESFFVPAVAPTVPLLFVATQAEKTQQNGTTPAAGTFESGVVRTVTSLNQSVELYGEPSFLEDSAGVALHGDARNEYGLFALNQYLGIGNRAFVVRADVNLDDDIDNLRTIWDSKFVDAGTLLTAAVTSFLTEWNESRGLVATDALFRTSVTEAEFLSLARTATDGVWDFSSFANSEDNYFDDHTDNAAGTSGSQETFHSSCHGAGRCLSRSAAIKQCSGRRIDKELFDKSGIIVRAKGRSTLAEEAPEAYKDVESVVNVVHNAGISKKVARMKPLGVIKG